MGVTKRDNNAGISGKEVKVLSYLELEKKRFFSRSDIKRFFSSENEMNVYIHRMRRKGRIVKINEKKYYFVPLQAVDGKWSEHPFIIVDEMCNGRGYCIGGKSAAHYWGIIDQLPTELEVFSRSRQSVKNVLGAKIRFRRVRRMPECVRRHINGHPFIMSTKKESEKWK